MKYLWLLFLVCLCGCTLSTDAKLLNNTTFCLKGERYLITDCYPCFGLDACTVRRANFPFWTSILNTDDIKIILSNAERECP